MEESELGCWGIEERELTWFATPSSTRPLWTGMQTLVCTGTSCKPKTKHGLHEVRFKFFLLHSYCNSRFINLCTAAHIQGTVEHWVPASC
jgi:hypothetical protein